MLKSFLFRVKDHRRKQGRRYELGHILLFTILAILSGADSYRKVQKFIQDQKAIQILSAFASDSQIILAHEEIATKTNEIPTAQTLLTELELSGYIFTFDALHCQKNATNG